MAEEKGGISVDGAGIYALANKPTVALQSPMDALTQAGQAAAVVNANRLFRANVARGQIMRQAIDPATGMPNPATANRLLAASTDPDVALVAPEAVNQSQALQGAQQNQALQRFQWMAGAVGSLMSDNGGAGPTWDRMKQTLAAGLHGGYLTPQDAQAAIVGMPQGDDPQSMATRSHMIATINEQLQSAQQRLGNTTYDPTDVVTGPNLQPYTRGGRLSATPGALTPAGAPVTVGLPTAAQKINPVPGPVGPGGVPTQETLGSSLTRQGLDQNGDPIPNPAFATVPSALRGPNAARPTATPVPTGMGPSQTSAASTTGAQSAEAFQSYSNEASKAVSQSAVLSGMLADANQFTTGPGADSIKSFKASVQRIGNTLGTSFGIDPQQLAANESFDKLAAQIADAQGAKSDARLSVTQAANPSSHLSPEGVQLIVRQLQGNTDYIRAKAQLANAYPDKADRAGFEASVASNLDPRAFQYERLTPAQKSTYFRNVNDKAAFVKAHEWAASHGLFGGKQGG